MALLSLSNHDSLSRSAPQHWIGGAHLKIVVPDTRSRTALLSYRAADHSTAYSVARGRKTQRAELTPYICLADPFPESGAGLLPNPATSCGAVVMASHGRCPM